MPMELSKELLNELLSYDDNTGKLTWNYRDRNHFKTDGSYKRWNNIWAGKEAFSSTGNHGYKQGSVLGTMTLAHRVVWKMVYDSWPIEIDHEDHDKTNNRLSNLKHVDHLTNCMNTGFSKNNTSGVNGVSFVNKRQKFEAYINAGKKRKFLGYFKTIEEASLAVENAKNELGFHSNHGKQ